MPTASHNQILRAIGASGPVTRTELVARTGLSKAAMSGLTRELIETGLIHETDLVAGAGRPSAKLDMRPEGAYFIGVSMLTDPAIVALTDLKGNIVARLTMPRSADPEQFARDLGAHVPKLLDMVPTARERLTGIGVALSGLIDQLQETCIASTLLGWKDVPLAQLVHKAVGLPTYIENDAKALALSEKLFGSARDMQNFTVVSLGDGIGCAHFIRDQLHRGAHGGAGEIAHSTIEPYGLPCRCGKVGCLDTIASVYAQLALANSAGIPATSLNDIELAATRGSAEAIALLHRAGNALGLAIANVIQINDPELVVIAHQEPSFSGLFATVVLQAIENNVLPRLSGRTPIRSQKLSDDVWARGAAGIATHNFLLGFN